MSVQPTSPSASPNARLTRWTVTAITLLIAALAFAFCFGNAHDLCISLGLDGWIAWLIGPSVDLSVIGLLVAVRYLASAGYSGADLAKPRCLLGLCGLLTLALNTADALTHGQFGTAAVNAIGPILLICWSDVGPWLLAELAAVAHRDHESRRIDTGQLSHAGGTAEDGPTPQDDLPDIATPAAVAGLAGPEASQADLDLASGAVHCEPADPAQVEADLWHLALSADAEHRASTGRPISRDALRGALHIGRDRASDLNRRLREHAASAARFAEPTESAGKAAPADDSSSPDAIPVPASNSA
ncbi:DUF2637 domain-containing protein [Actinospica durhamensis]|uniref:DUF2637 domain-containing protein n=1 Tax=Actinospica durhamensis TaxID=1508375 RepID=A0A941ENB6_9ACTN|nr:DUF2637 domain-containing protein [Actinospica durhamensis]MBR7833617.1 DUF2637 domain-containing protein [Actinospica durhamensis]